VRRRLIAILDDDPSTVHALARALSPEFDLTLATSPDVLLNRIRAGFQYDAIISDMFMPVSGKAFYEQVEAISPSQASRIVFVTGQGLPESLDRFLRKHIYVNKPVSLPELHAAIELVTANYPTIPPPKQ
jgi:CheY-like chemotaxis protein